MPFDILSNSIDSLRDSVVLLQKCDGLLQTTINKVSYRNKIATRQVFGLTTQSDLNDAKLHFRNNIHQQLRKNTHTINHLMQELTRRKSSLENLRVQQSKVIDHYDDVDDLIKQFEKSKTVDRLKLRKLIMLKEKKERLKYTLARSSGSTFN
ncbi:uncharacterized protein SPAPADRAFT_58091 [Spathaspora passalidarum NRRL Y-27907]|uniref:DASH complex subunit SPC19 n=1 Tax=Spathaspora passalidarum (strain NRRL Y-27907 / 11-Y1) TaxID=619300 RepID=G3AFH9_SPAPN|nr:uncharacterized protein SPAPADRAFT_58091 [Spathaspora passalidarum NRRL Y-27907]EGW34968.1 hypothetical protein SPAPADRAFT_58091 [Spathaspora passalidarum NRRL Y-27907]